MSKIEIDLFYFKNITIQITTHNLSRKVYKYLSGRKDVFQEYGYIAYIENTKLNTLSSFSLKIM